MEKARKCHVCGQQGKWGKCKICKEQYDKITYYCSKECQRADFHHHRETDHCESALAPWGGEEGRATSGHETSVGQLKDGKPHGKCCIYRDDVVGPLYRYEGYFKNGDMYKSTNNTDERGGKYLGYINSDGQQHGRGGMVSPTGVSYYGDWYENKETGKGIVSNGHQTYVGEMKDGIRHGHGKDTNRMGDFEEIKEGEFENGKLVRGKYTTYNTVCEGTFRDERLHGEGVRKYTDKGGRKPPQVGFFNDGKFTKGNDETGGWGAAGGGPGGAAGGKDMKTHADLLADSVCMLHARICALERKWEI
jgi:MYND finger/MORN repeat